MHLPPALAGLDGKDVPTVEDLVPELAVQLLVQTPDAASRYACTCAKSS
jgi:hypothetical protein